MQGRNRNLSETSSSHFSCDGSIAHAPVRPDFDLSNLLPIRIKFTPQVYRIIGRCMKPADANVGVFSHERRLALRRTVRNAGVQTTPEFVHAT